MVFKYTRLTAANAPTIENWMKWTRNRMPVAFFRQQLVLVSLVVGSTILLLFTTFFTTDIEYELIHGFSDFEYGVIVDCGSSGSRAHIFRWRVDLDMKNNIELVRDPSSGLPLNKHISPGLSTFRDEPDKASDYLEPIMGFISESIPSDKHLETSIYFMATAGLRLLEETTQKRILSDIRKDLRLKFGFPKIKSQVISGTLEGVYSWLSLNMNRNYHISESKSNVTKSYGMIEMGGASTQVAFELNPQIENEITKELEDTDAIAAFKNQQVVLNLGPDESVKLFATTFLGLGVNSAREASIDLMVREYLNGTGELNALKRSEFKDHEIDLMDPCLTAGSSEIVMRPVSLLENLQHSIGSTIKQGETTFKVRLKGSGDFVVCINLLDNVLQLVKSEKLNCNIENSKPSCSMSLLGTNFIPYKYYQFIGLSEMFFTTNEMMDLAGNFNRSKVLHETQRICSTQYNKLLEMYSKSRKVSHEDRVLYECFKASWLLTLLHNNSGLKMPAEYNKFTTLSRLNDVEIDWTIGAMMAEVALNKINSPMI